MDSHMPLDILAIESSCDETAAAVVRDGRQVLSNVINTQVAEHGKYGGVVPEIASRRHIENIVGVVDEALSAAGHTLDTVGAIAVTAAPGLIGALLVGVNYAKGLSLVSGKPLVPVHHLRGHVAANYLAHPELEPPYLDVYKRQILRSIGVLVSPEQRRMAEKTAEPMCSTMTEVRMRK